MRTTIEISDTHRAKLLELAAERGEKGFSRLVREALEQFLVAEVARGARVNAALSAIGSLTDAQADRLHDQATRLRA